MKNLIIILSVCLAISIGLFFLWKPAAFIFFGLTYILFIGLYFVSIYDRKRTDTLNKEFEIEMARQGKKTFYLDKEQMREIEKFGVTSNNGAPIFAEDLTVWPTQKKVKTKHSSFQQEKK